VHALRDADVLSDPRLSAPYGKDWLPGVHARNSSASPIDPDSNVIRFGSPIR
jgi:hypothetical protein